MKPTVEEIGSLLALKRHERPEDGYFDGFVREFHQRLREEEARRHGLAGWWRNASGWFSEVGASKWLYGGGLAYATIVAIAMTVPRGQEAIPAVATPVSHEVRSDEPVKVEQLDSLDLRPSTQGKSGEQEF